MSAQPALWGAASVSLQRRWAVYLAAGLAAFAFGVGVRHALGHPGAQGLSPGAYVLSMWPAQAPAWQAFLGELARQLLWGPGLAWALGFTVFASPLALLAPLVRGYMLGSALTWALAGWGWDGLVTVALTLLPLQLCLTLAATRAAAGATEFGLVVARSMLGVASHELPGAFATYLRLGLRVLLMAAAGAALALLGAGWLRGWLAAPPAGL
ncbi:MAG: hypothetical protein IMX02_04000 [Limnochordaceae bacterium]|nr:hypothetical protein [Limnochordaceae bacterium]